MSLTSARSSWFPSSSSGLLAHPRRPLRVACRNHRMYDPLEPGSPFSLDVSKIEQEIKSLAMPGQEVSPPSCRCYG
eukprot:380687-Hanusia_phi.AAC.6